MIANKTKHMNTILRGCIMFVPPPATKFWFNHCVASLIVSVVATFKDEENVDISSLKAIILKESSEENFEIAVDSASVVLSSVIPCMLLLVSTTNTTLFLKT